MTLMPKSLLLGLLALAGCGGGATDARVREYVPDARGIRCEHPSRSLTRCQAEPGNSLTGSRTRTCEFAFERSPGGLAHSGSGSCWSDTR